MFSDITVAKFWSKVDKSAGPDGCWVWTGCLNQNGYGSFSSPLGSRNAHRVAWQIINGPIASKDIFVCHSCDNPPCVNPSHLWLGSNHENILDMLSKGRHYRQLKTHCVKGHPLVEGNLRKRTGKRAQQRECLTCDREGALRRKKRA